MNTWLQQRPQKQNTERPVTPRSCSSPSPLWDITGCALMLSSFPDAITVTRQPETKHSKHHAVSETIQWALRRGRQTKRRVKGQKETDRQTNFLEIPRFHCFLHPIFCLYYDISKYITGFYGAFMFSFSILPLLLPSCFFLLVGLWILFVYHIFKSLRLALLSPEWWRGL